ncbi:MAG: response regulator [Candidatus Melainabacteria bacterium]|nr:response regulator [Candidatus Melainabacteria bacterium]
MTESPPLILIVEDEPEIRRFLRVSLTSNGYQLLEATRGAEALQLAAEKKPQLIILDLGLPDLDGTEVARKIREWSQVPIIILSARNQEVDKVTALELGADDYLTKPFGVYELLARIKVALKHASQAKIEPGDPVFSAGQIRVDMAKRLVFLNDVEVHLTPNEYNLLLILVQSPGKLISQQQLLRAVWGPGYAKEGHYLRVYMGQLRRKLEVDPANPKHLITEPGLGYRFCE